MISFPDRDVGAVAGLTVDLFGTLVFFDVGRIPRHEVEGKDQFVTIPGLNDLLASLVPRTSVTDFVDALHTVSAQIADEKARTHIEISSPVRFERAIRYLELSGDIDAVANEMTRQHMETLATTVDCPPDRRALLDALRAHVPVALISNFDHAPTALGLLDRFGIADAFDHVVISDAVGLCKPHPDIFRDACREIGVEPSHCMHVGDSMRADIKGAKAAGLKTVWISAEPDEGNRPDHVVADISELSGWLDR